MSEDVSTPIPDEPGQDPDAAEPGPYTDGYGFSDSPDSGYELGEEDPSVPSDVETSLPSPRQGEARVPDAGPSTEPRAGTGPDGEPL